MYTYRFAFKDVITLLLVTKVYSVEQVVSIYPLPNKRPYFGETKTVVWLGFEHFKILYLQIVSNKT